WLPQDDSVVLYARKPLRHCLSHREIRGREVLSGCALSVLCLSFFFVLALTSLVPFNIGLVYEILDKALGLPPPAEGYQYRNVQIDVWKRNLEEQKKADAERAQKLSEGTKRFFFHERHSFLDVVHHTSLLYCHSPDPQKQRTSLASTRKTTTKS